MPDFATSEQKSNESERTLNNVHVAIISARRPERVVPMMKWCPNATWYVAKGETNLYRDAGAANVVEGGGLCESRNLAIDTALYKGQLCVQLSDDLSAIKRAHNKKEVEAITLESAIKEMITVTSKIDAKLAGCAPTSNPFYYNPEKPYRSAGFIVADFILIRPCELRFDTKLRLKEDYDFTLQHLAKYGRVARLDNLMASFAHRTNKGGAVAYRTSELEQQSIAYLRTKWGKAIKNNPRRENEILLNI